MSSDEHQSVPPRPSVVAPPGLEEFLRGCGLFRGCDPSVVAKVAPHAEFVEVQRGGVLYRAGTPADAIYIVLRGRANHVVVNAVNGTTTVVDTLQPGDHAGDIGALNRVAQPYTLLSDEGCAVARLRLDIFETLLAKVPQMVLNIARRLAMRNVAISLTTLRAAPAPLPSPTPSMAPVAGVRFVEIAEFDPPMKVVQMIPARLAVLHRVIPLQLQGSVLTVGMTSPRNNVALAELRQVLHPTELEVVAVAQDDLAQGLARYRLDVSARTEAGRGRTTDADAIQYDAVDPDRDSDKGVRVVGDEVVRAVNRIVAGALQREASDIHMEPDVAGVRVRYRVQGLMHDAPEVIPPSFARGLVARVKVLAGLDITERRLPQDGRIGLSYAGREIDLRVSTLPSSRGETVVMRVLEGGGMSRPLEQVFVEPGTLAAARRALLRPHGAVIVAGATGSGKSSTLYTMLQERRRLRPDSSVLMVEDPIEYRLSGVTQVQVNAAMGLGFAQVLRASLRQDPDVIVVGETRDSDTAKLALESAMTGHLLFTSLHANDVAATLQRLDSLGCGRTLVAQSVAVVISQRLVRKLCAQCARVEAPPAALVEALVARRLIERGTAPALPRAIGCDACGGTGYAGRIAVVEQLALGDEVRNALMGGDPLPELLRAAAMTRSFLPFAQCATHLMARRTLAATEALLAVAE